MPRVLLISCLLIAASFGCAPHKPKRPPGKPTEPPTPVPPTKPTDPPPKECVELTDQWSTVDCATALSTPFAGWVCDAFTSTKTAFSCPKPREQPVAKGANSHALLTAITCDKATGKWVYEHPDGPKNDESLAALLGAPLQFSCTKQG